MKFDVKEINVEPLKITESISITSALDISSYIKNYRKTHKLSQEELAKYTNVSRIAISEFETGKTDIRLSTLLKIIKVCSLSLELKER